MKRNPKKVCAPKGIPQQVKSKKNADVQICGSLPYILINAAKRLEAGDRSPVDDPKQLRAIARDLLVKLLAMAERGDINAASCVAGELLTHVKDLQKVCERNLELFQKVAHGMTEWPIVANRWFFKDKDIDPEQRKVMELLRDLRIVPKYKRSSRGTFETEIARLVFHNVNSFLKSKMIYGDKIVAACVPTITQCVNEVEPYYPMTQKNWRVWWRICKPVFILYYGKQFEDHPGFSRYWKSRQWSVGRKQRPQIRNAIINQIGIGFRSIAPK